MKKLILIFMLTLGILPYFDASGLKITASALYAQSSGEESDEGWDWGGSPSSPQEAAAKGGMPVLASANIDVNQANVTSSGGKKSATYPIQLAEVNVTAYSSSLLSTAEYYSLINNLSGSFNFSANVQPFSFDGQNELKEVTITATRSDGGLSDFDYFGFLNWLRGGIQSYNDYVDVTEHIDEQPEPPTLSLTLSATRGMPTKWITITANIGGGAIESPELKYYGEFAGVETELEGGITKGFNSIDYQIKVLGKIRFRVKLSYRQNNQISTIFSNWQEFTSVFTREDFLKSSKSQMTETSKCADAEENAQKEFGFQADCDGTSIVNVDNLTTTGTCDVRMEIYHTGREGGSDVNNTSGQGIWTVGHFHTHPNFKSCQGYLPAGFGPSDKDLKLNMSYPAYVYDYITTTTNITPAKIDYDRGGKLYPYGVTETTY